MAASRATVFVPEWQPKREPRRAPSRVEGGVNGSSTNVYCKLVRSIRLLPGESEPGMR